MYIKAVSASEILVSVGGEYKHECLHEVSQKLTDVSEIFYLQDGETTWPKSPQIYAFQVHNML